MKRIIYIFCFAFLMFGCSKSSDDGSGEEIPDPTGETQDTAVGVDLVFPHEDSLCTEGTDITPTESTVFFEWEPNNNAESYTLTVENLETNNVEQYQTADFIYGVTIQRAVAFRWFVTYEFQGETKESDIWHFYNSGPGVQTYAPFPAEIVSPTMAQSIASTSSVTLQWNGSDVDNDIVGYDVYFGTEANPSLEASDITDTQLSVSVASGIVYYWNITTKDSEGNTSESGVYQFEIQ